MSKIRRGPKPKPLAERRVAEAHQIQRPIRTYSRAKKLQVLKFLSDHRVPCALPSESRSPSQDEAALHFQIPQTTISGWVRNSDRILEARKGERIVKKAVTSHWPEMEEKLNQRFLEERDAGRAVRRGWFRRISGQIFKRVYLNASQGFPFSNGWFQNFLQRYRISLRFTTRKAQRVPEEYRLLILNWIRFNRRNSQPATGPNPFLDLILSPNPYGKFLLSNICNLDETPLPFEYLSGRTYNPCGSRTVWVKETRSGWDKRQATLILCIFADGIDRIAPMIIFHSTGWRLGGERARYDPRVLVRFNPTAYSNESLFLSYIDTLLAPSLQGRPSLFAIDVAEFHKTPAVVSKLESYQITPSMIPAGCTGLVQPLDVSVNRPFKDILRDLTEQEIIQQEANGLERWSLSDRRVSTTWCVGQAWAQFTGSARGKKIIQDSFRNVGLALPIDGSQDSELNIKGFTGAEMVIGDWSQGTENIEDSDTPIDETEDENPLVDFI